MTPEPGDWPRRFAAALEQAGGGDGLALSDTQVDAVLDLARDVAHGTERRYAPLSTYLAGGFVTRRIAAGVSADEALEEAQAIARRLLEEDVEGAG